MDEYETTPELTRNPVTHERHRREVLWQITLPVAIGGVALLVFSILAAVGINSDQQSLWADISLIWLIVPMLFASLILLILVAGLAYAVFKLIEVLPPYAHQVQIFFARIQAMVSQLGDKAVEPVLRSHSFAARLHSLGSQARRTRRGKNEKMLE